MIAEKAWYQNHPSRLTGDGACIVADYLLRKRSTVSREMIYALVEAFVVNQVHTGVVKIHDRQSDDARQIAKMMAKVEGILRNYREGL